ncbi:Gastric triacylglycerol lipase [Frankliniella fusca]|uniref:Gastric triacylglycerol lipase n=1 Tax=Frankliniella fusca TaxID=407009 RepID=A0AAE1I3V4_9NEOP|nr:Gastric triacylglycerol lipase [Frankliniella fusca]
MMAGVVKALLAAVLLCAVLTMAVDPKAEHAPDGLLLSAYLFSRSSDLSSWHRGFNPLLDLDPVALSRYWGYDAELHHVTTDDGYILGIHRISGSPSAAGSGFGSQHGNNGLDGADDGGASRAGDKRRSLPGQKPVVILAHPLLSSSSDWIILGPGKALAYLLADEGFDVWMMNVRGNTHSLNHTTLSPKSPAFWDFTYHEHATQDMPALIEYVIRETGEQQLQYVGFSMGTTIMFIMASERPEVAKHIRMFTGLGPVASLLHTRSTTFRLLAHLSPALMRSSAFFGINSFLPSTPALRKAGEIFCSDGSLTQGLCESLIAALSGRNDKQFNATMLPYIISRTPSGTSFKTINHYSQSLKHGFRRYDYGASENLKRYGLETAPLYNLSNVRVPSRLYYGLNDHLSDARDVVVTCSQLPSVINCEAVDDPLWTHLDFTWGKQAPELVYRRIIADIKESNAAA